MDFERVEDVTRPRDLSGAGYVPVPDDWRAQYAALSVAEQRLLSEQIKAEHLKRCRESYPVFGEYVLVDETTREHIKQAPVHVAWDELCNEHKRLVIISHVSSGKSSSISVGRTLWELGRNPNIRIAIVSNVAEQAGKLLSLIAQYIEESERLHEVFPNLVKGKGVWQPTKAITVQRAAGAKDPSVAAYGAHGNIIGARLNLIILDDILDFDNTRTEHQRKAVIDWFSKTLAGRTADRIWSLGVPHHKKDLQHELIGRGFRAFRFPVERDGVILHPGWDREKIEQARQDMGPIEAARQLDCRARSDEDAAFKAEDIQACIDLGAGYDLIYEIGQLEPGVVTVTGVDLAVKRGKKNDMTAIVTLIGYPDGRKQIAMVESGRWRGREIIDRVIATQQRYQSVVYLEDNGSQAFLLEFTAEAKLDIPIRGFTTGMNKHQAYGIESIAAEMAAKKWVIPSTNGKCQPEVQKLLNELLYYDADSHTGDRLSATWIAKEGLRLLRHQSQPSSLTVSTIRTGKRRPSRIHRRGTVQPVQREGFHEIEFVERKRR